MMLANPKEIDDLEIHVVENLNLRRILVKEYLGAARKWLNVGSVLGQQGDDLFGQAVFAADICEGTNHAGGD
jgi:hypothetical protein